MKERPIGTNEISKDNMYKIEREINWDQRFDSVKNRRIGIKGTHELYRPDLIVRKIGTNKSQNRIGTNKSQNRICTNKSAEQDRKEKNVPEDC